MKKILTALTVTLVLTDFFNTALACSRFIYKGFEDRFVTARSMDWKEDIGTNLWIFPRGMQRDGATGANTMKWQSKYGSVIASGYDFSTTDGVNEEGLVANLLWLAESNFPAVQSSRPSLSAAVWPQYFLDNFATVQEAVDAIQKDDFDVISKELPGTDRMATLHLAISDKYGDSAIFEYIDKKLVIHHSKDYTVMTNSPTFDEQLALVRYWEEIGGTVMLPGTNRAADRFVRAKFYSQSSKKPNTMHETIAAAFGIIRNVSVPFGISTPDQPNISTTVWRSVVDQHNKVYYFESAMTPNIFWVELNKVDFSAGAKVKKLDLGKNQSTIFSGEVHDKFKEAKPFEYLGF